MIFGKQISSPFIWSLLCWGLLMYGLPTSSSACESLMNAGPIHPEKKGSLRLDTIMNNLGQLTIREQSFRETYYSGMLMSPSYKEGTLIFQPPDRLEKHVRIPSEESFIARGDTLLYSNPSRDISQTISLQEYPALAMLIEGLRALFSGNKETLGQFFEISIVGTPEDWGLVLSPIIKDEEEGVDCIQLTGERTHLHTISIQESNGDRSELQLGHQVP